MKTRLLPDLEQRRLPSTECGVGATEVPGTNTSPEQVTSIAPSWVCDSRVIKAVLPLIHTNRNQI